MSDFQPPYGSIEPNPRWSVGNFVALLLVFTVDVVMYVVVYVNEWFDPFIHMMLVAACLCLARGVKILNRCYFGPVWKSWVSGLLTVWCMTLLIFSFVAVGFIPAMDKVAWAHWLWSAVEVTAVVLCNKHFI